MSRRRRWIVLPLAALAAILLGVLVLFDWNWFKGPLEGAVSTALEREFEVADLDVELGAPPTVTLEQVRIANAAWGSRPDMLTIRQVRFAIDLWPALKGAIRLPFLQVQEPDLLLETNQEGLANWTLGEQDEAEAPPVIPIIRDLEVVDAIVRYHEPGRAQDLVATLETVAGAMTGSGIQLSAEGTLNEESLSLRLAGAPAERLEAATEAERFPFELDARLGSTRITATGSAEQLLQAQGMSVELNVESQDPGTLLTLAGRERRSLGDLHLTLSVTSQDQIWTLQQIDLRFGQSDLQGRATVQLGQPEPLIAADLASQQVRVEDLRPLLSGAAAQPSDASPEAALDTAIADAKTALAADKQTTDRGGPGLQRDMLPKVDAEVSYTVGRLSGPDLALSGLELHARLTDGLPRLELTGGGEYRGTPVALDVQLGRTRQGAPTDRAYPVQARIEAAATQIQIDGVIGEPETLDGLDLRVQASSENLDDVLALADVDLPQIPPFAISGHVVQDGQVWRIADFYGQFSESELAGDLTVDLSRQRPFITAALQSNRLLVSDLVTAGDKAAVVGDEVADTAADAKEEEVDATAAKAEADEIADAAGGAGDERQGQVALISLEGVNLEALPEIDADISFQGQYVEFQEFRFDQLGFDLQLRDAVAVLDASGHGQYRDEPLSLEAHAGTEESLENPEQPYPIDLKLTSEETKLAVKGTVARPGQLAGLDVDVALAGPDLDRVGDILQLSLPTTPPFDLRSHLTHNENRWNFTGLNGTIGDSDIQGDATIVLGGERPTLEAELTSNKLDFDDLGLLVGAPADPDETVSVEQERAAAEEAAQEGVLPDEPFDVPELRAMDARVSYRAKQVQAQMLPLEGMVLDLTLEDGQLTFEPLRFDLADGKLVSTIRLDGRTDVLAGELELNVRNIRLNQLLSRFDIDVAEIEVEQEGVGTFSGQADLEVRGNSIQELAGSADGEVAFIMSGGQINALILEAIGLDVGEAVALLLSGEEEEQSEMVPIQCFVARFEVQDGVMQTKALVLETSDSTITGRGQIDLGKETLSLELLAHPKDASALTASTPVRIEGTFKNPEIDLISEELQEKGLAALALGVVLPVVGAIIPFFEKGETEDTNCARLIQAASEAVQSEPSPPRSD